tara:strand:+ start:2208 stop:3164 length:957 start_codon:yes stop_codon:yes gene_type:complete
VKIIPKNFVFRVSGNSGIGSGHLFHSITLNKFLHEKGDISTFLLYKCDKFVEDQLKLNNINYLYEKNLSEQIGLLFKKDYKNILINDVLDTTKGIIQLQKKAGYQVINIEDLGEGAHHADIVINALYSEINGLKNQYVGPAYTILRDEFKKATESIEYEKNDQVIISFGGVDPNKISETIYHELSKTDIPFYIIEPPFRKLNIVSEQILKKPIEMAKVMSKARVVISSMGRTVFEAASLGIPIISIAQNEREASHISQYLDYINYVGQFADVDIKTIVNQLLNIYNDKVKLKKQRQQLFKLVDFKGANRIKDIISSLE